MTAVPILSIAHSITAQDTGFKQHCELNGVANYVASFQEPKPLQQSSFRGGPAVARSATCHYVTEAVQMPWGVAVQRHVRRSRRCRTRASGIALKNGVVLQRRGGLGNREAPFGADLAVVSVSRSAIASRVARVTPRTVSK
jgi:hypothetical protein